MKPAAKSLTIQKPEQKRKADPVIVSADGFTRINESTIRKIYR